MKKAFLILLCISGALIISGFAVVAATGFAIPMGTSARDRVTLYDTPKLVEKQVEISQCSSVDLNLVNCRLTVKKYDGKTIRLSYNEKFENQWDYSLSGSKLSLRLHNNKWYQNIFDWFRRNADWNSANAVELSVPDGCTLSYDIDDVNGKSTISDLKAEDMDISGVNSEYSLENISISGKASLENVNGSFNLKNVTSPKLEFSDMTNSGCDMENPQIASIDARDFVNGHLNITGAVNPDDYTVKYRFVNGSLSFNGENYNGKGRVGNADAKNSINFEGTNSDLKIEFAK